MFNMKSRTFQMIAFFSAIAFLAGCNSKGTADNNPAAEKPPEPVTLQLASQGVVILDEEFQQVTNEFLRKKYPHITINYNPDAKGTTLDDLIASGNTPDIVVTYNGMLPSYRTKDLVFDMTPLLQNIDLNKFEPNYIQDVRNAAEKGELYGLPINVNYHAMYYNKTIFDKFGAPYPTDGMDWTAVLELAKKVTRMDGGTQYRGLDPGNGIVWISQPLSVAAIDPFTDKATMNNDQWKRVFELVKSIYDIPGNGRISESPKNQFMKSQTLAILLDLNILNQLAEAEKEGLVWDIAQYPSYPEKPNTYGNASVYTMIATKPSKYHKEVAQVIELFTSEEVQLELSRRGLLSPLKSEKVKQELGANKPNLKDKSLPSIFKSKPVPYPVASRFRTKAESIASAKFWEYANGQIDVNTALAQADEEINQMVAAELGAQK